MPDYISNMKNTPRYAIKAVTARTGLSPHVIRIWERRYKAVVPERTRTNHRIYSEKDIHRLNLLRMATETGLSIGQIAQLPNEELSIMASEDLGVRVSGGEGYENIPDGELRFESHIDACLDATMSLDEQELEQCLIRAGVGFSQPHLLSGVIEPFIELLGSLWQDGTLRIVHEHLASEVVRRYLGSMIENTSLPKSAPRLITTTPSGQIHELGALIAGVTAAGGGWRVTYLGPNLPAEEIAAAMQALQSKNLLLSLVYPTNDHKLGGELRRLRKALPRDAKVIVGGRAALFYETALLEIGATVVSNTNQLHSILDSIRKN